MYYGVATISRLLKRIGLFCKRALWKILYSAKETYNFQEPTDRSHPIYMRWLLELPVGSLKLQVSFAEYSLFYRALLHNRPIISRSLLIVAIPLTKMTVELTFHNFACCYCYCCCKFNQSVSAVCVYVCVCVRVCLCVYMYIYIYIHI